MSAAGAALSSLQRGPYGACLQGPGDDELDRAKTERPLLGHGPLKGAMNSLCHGPMFLENPDGTITEAVPSDRPDAIKKPYGGGDAADGDIEGTDGSDDGLATAYQDFECLYCRHERIFLVLLSLQLSLEILYGFVFVVRMEPSIMELRTMYDLQVSHKSAKEVLWALFGAEVVYSLVYYIFVGLAIWTRRPKRFQVFATWSLGGAVFLALLAYVGKFNLPIFFLRLLTYIYARFLQGLTSSLMLLPPPEPLQASPAA